MKKSYAEQLRDPRWQKKRLEILEKRGAKCEDCGKTCRVEVHHSWYDRGKEPWDYADQCFVVQCPDCHEKRQTMMRGLWWRLSFLRGDKLQRFIDAADLLASGAYRQQLGDLVSESGSRQ